MARDTTGLRRGGPGRPKGSPNKSTVAIRETSQRLLSDPEYQAALKIRLRRGTAGPVEPLLYHYAFGRPKETIAVESDVPPFILKIEHDDSDGD